MRSMLGAEYEVDRHRCRVETKTSVHKSSENQDSIYGHAIYSRLSLDSFRVQKRLCPLIAGKLLYSFAVVIVGSKDGRPAGFN
jgi:hypothetical protein